MSEDLENIERIAELIIKHYNEELIDPADKASLKEWLDRSESNRRLFERYSDDEYIIGQLIKFRDVDQAGEWKKLLAVISKDASA